MRSFCAFFFRKIEFLCGVFGKIFDVGKLLNKGCALSIVSILYLSIHIVNCLIAKLPPNLRRSFINLRCMASITLTLCPVLYRHNVKAFLRVMNVVKTLI